MTTLHTILAEPDAAQRAVMDELVARSERLVVMSEHGKEVLAAVHGVAEDRIDVIPHGIPPAPSLLDAKAQLGLSSRSVILTFGLLSPDKGIEQVVEALPAIVRAHPDALYLLVGATHPHVKERHGESYRQMLEARASELGVSAHFRLHDHFVSPEELSLFMAAADLYVTPYINQEQSTSGTLAYAVGAGKAVISTPYLYARELLADGRGVLVPRRDPSAMAHAVIGLLRDPGRRRVLELRAGAYGATMRWPDVALAYRASFERARRAANDRARGQPAERPTPARPAAPKAFAPAQQPLPEVRLEHLSVLTDGTGLLQHAMFDVPRYDDGYCLDDNARGLILTTLLSASHPQAHALGTRYAAFVSHAFDASSGRFRNFMTYDRRWDPRPGSEDSHGRALWALGTVVGKSTLAGRRRIAAELFHAALGASARFTSPRAWAYALLGIDAYLTSAPLEGHIERLRADLGERLLDVHRRTSSEPWPWFEEHLTYCNARLPQALLGCGVALGNAEMQSVALRSLDWLATIQRAPEGTFAPVGSEGFYRQGGAKAAFDQQPVEAAAMVSACLLAHRVTGERRFEDEARRAFGWFLGANHLGHTLSDRATGGCHDGLHEGRANENQGAESTLSFLAALVEMRQGSPRASVPTSKKAQRGDAS